MEGLGPSAARQYKSLHGCILLFFSILGGTGRLFNLTGTPPQEQFQDVSIEAKYLQHRVARLELGPCSPHDKAVVRYDLPYCGTRLWYPPRLTTARPSGIPRSKTRGLTAPRAKTAKIWPGHILRLQSVPDPKSPKIY